MITFHGGASNKTLHWWSSQPLAEAGYLVVAFDSPAGPTPEDAAAIVDWLYGDDPLAADFDGERLGIAGHSRGGVVVGEFGQRERRVSAVVSWDRAQSTPLSADLALRTPTLFFFADYNCQNVPVCNPETYETRPDPDGPGNKGDDFKLLQEAGVDSMQVPLRAALHLDFVPSQLSGNRYAEIVAVYYTLAWFDRYVRGATESDVARDAFERLTATTFDDTADRHNISQGIFDPARAAASPTPMPAMSPTASPGCPSRIDCRTSSGPSASSPSPARTSGRSRTTCAPKAAPLLPWTKRQPRATTRTQTRGHRAAGAWPWSWSRPSCSRG